MNRMTTFVRMTLVVASLAAAPLSAAAAERDISGSITGGIITGYVFGVEGYGYAYGRGTLPHLGKTHLSADVSYAWWDPIHTVAISGLQLRAASGDLVYADCGPTATDEDAGELSWEITFSGGTGRFAEATGTTTLVLRISPEYWVDNGYGSVAWLGEYELIDATLDY